MNLCDSELPNGFQDRRHQPLGQSSKVNIYYKHKYIKCIDLNVKLPTENFIRIFYNTLRMHNMSLCKCRKKFEDNMSKKILIVSNEHDTHFILGSVLLSQGYNVRPAHNNNDALKKIKEDKFDLFVLDNSKQVDVKKLTKIFRKDRNLDPIPVILLYDEENRNTIDAWDAGADFCFPKPFMMQEVSDVIRSMLLNKEAKFTGSFLCKDDKIPCLAT